MNQIRSIGDEFEADEKRSKYLLDKGYVKIYVAKKVYKKRIKKD